MHMQVPSRKIGTLSAVRCALLMTLIMLVLSGCGGGGSEGESSPQAAAGAAPTPTPTPDPTPDPTPVPGQAANQKPTISGSAPAAVNANSGYSFTPTAVDADGDALTFSIQNKPSWATFAAATGSLSGTPGDADLGTYSNIVIGVSDGAASSTLSFSIAVTAMSNGRVTMSWMAPTQNTDGSALTNLAGYTLRYGTDANALTRTISITNASVTTYVVEDLSPATWYFAVTAVSSSGAESSNSNVASKTI